MKCQNNYVMNRLGKHFDIQWYSDLIVSSVHRDWLQQAKQ